MYAITVTEPGGPEMLTWGEVPDPEPGPGEALIEVVASAVNRADIMQRKGVYPPPEGASPYPGLECSGRILALGPGDTSWNVGDHVCALLSGGGYAERVAVPVGQLLPIPTGVSLVDAAALPEVACTVWSNVFAVGGLSRGQSVLIHGGGSGIGTFAIQLAHASGARVFTTAGSERKLDVCRSLGAEVTINYREEDFRDRVRSATNGAGVNVILDILGGSTLSDNIASLATDGCLVVIGLMGGRRAELDLGRMLAKRLSVRATTLRARSTTEKAQIVTEVRENVWPLIEAGTLRPIVDRTAPMAEAAEAHRVLESSEHIGKIVLTSDQRG